MSTTKTSTMTNPSIDFGDLPKGLHGEKSEGRNMRLLARHQLQKPAPARRSKIGSAVAAGGDSSTPVNPAPLTCSTPAPLTRGHRRNFAFPLSPITNRTQSKVVVPPDVSRFKEFNATASKENDLFQPGEADGGLSSTLFHPSMKSYTRTPSKRRKDDARVLHNLDVSWSSSSVGTVDVTSPVTSPVNPCDFLALEEPIREERLSPLDDDSYSPSSNITAIKRKRRLKKKPVWDEAPYRRIFAEINKEFDEIDRTELCFE